MNIPRIYGVPLPEIEKWLGKTLSDLTDEEVRRAIREMEEEKRTRT